MLEPGPPELAPPYLDLSFFNRGLVSCPFPPRHTISSPGIPCLDLSFWIDLFPFYTAPLPPSKRLRRRYSSITRCLSGNFSFHLHPQEQSLSLGGSSLNPRPDSPFPPCRTVYLFSYASGIPFGSPRRLDGLFSLRHLPSMRE